MVFLISLVSSLFTLSPRIWLSVSLNMSIPDLMMMTEMAAPKYASMPTPDIRNTIAATRVDADIIESKRASLPDALRASELTFSPVFFTYVPRTILTTTATATMMSVTVLYSGVTGLIIFLTDSIREVIPA